MSVSTSQQIQRYYDNFSPVDVTFTREVIKATLLYPKQVFLKCVGYQWPCILYSCSMTSAKVIVNVQAQFKQIAAKANNLISLRYSFIQRDRGDPLSFFVNTKITEYAPYSIDNPELNFLTLSFTSRPPDDLIEKLGQLIEAQASSRNRREERVVINPETIKLLGINARHVLVTIDHMPRKCILRDVAFSGAKLIIMGVPKFLVNKDITLKLNFNEPDAHLEIQGTVIRFEPIEGRQDIGAFVIQFTEETIPVEYKMRLTNYFKHLKVKKPEATKESE